MPPVSATDYNTSQANKRRRLSLPKSSSSSSTKSNTSGQVDLDTPPSSAPRPTMSLRLTIPQPELNKEDQRKFAIRRVAAERWKSKLQRPFPLGREIREAYKLKLMRHYTNPSTPSMPDFIKPRIDHSPRVTGLLKQFPLLNTSNTGPRGPALGAAPALPPTTVQILKTEQDYMQLTANKSITRSEDAQRLAWKNFSATESDRIDRGREAMMESGLVVDDLVKEDRGLKNGLPEWKKLHTGKFAAETRAMRK
jgi:hypothetical protein